jgi:D-alanyl-D-alanine carboxypeptidase (penicillin-binding protein 5/6)
VRCIDKKRRLLSIILIIVILSAGCISKKEKLVTEYETTNYDTYLYEGELFASQLCVSDTNVPLNDFEAASSLHAGALFGMSQQKVFYSEQIHDRLFPASTTKILTLYLALKYGTLSDIVTVSDNAVAVPSDSSVAGLRSGVQLTLEDLLYGLMLPSGNDSAVAIAEHISGSVDAFVELMNKEANALGATNSHFVNPHGYHDENHYTTAYDLYLIFNQGILNQKFIDIISSATYTTDIKEPDGSTRSVTWKQSNLFVNGTRTAPENVTVIGGKTGTTDEAGACLVLYEQDSQSRPYISIVMGAESKNALYNTMDSLLSTISGLSQ